MLARPTVLLSAACLSLGCGGPSIETPDRPGCCGAPDDSAAPATDSGDADDSGDTQDTGDTGSADDGHTPLVVSFTEDLARTDGNPLRGFMTSYNWGTPITDQPASLEFAYVPLSALVDGPDSQTFETGLEPLLVAAEARGHQLVFRPYIDYPGLPSGLPSYLDGQVELRPYTDHGGGASPDYSEPALQDAILTFIDALGTRYDGDPRLAVVQLGLLGFWGEWHTWPHSDWFADALFQEEVQEAYDNAFSTTLLQTRYPSTTAAARRIGFHDDSFAYSTVGETSWFFVPQMETAGAESRWQQVIVGGELRPELQTIIFEPDYTTGTYQQDFATCVEATHASYLLNYTAFGRLPGSTAEEDNTRAAARMLGYALHLLEADLGPDTLTLTVENQGVAPFYLPLEVRVTDAVGTEVAVDPGRILPDAQASEIALDVTALVSPSEESPWTIHLESDHVLPSQRIRFATAPGSGAIRVE